MRKIFYNENPIIDLSNITVTPETLFSGSRCLNSNGEMINGSVVPLENTAELVKVYVATNHDTYGATGRYTFEFTYADDSGVHTVSCKNGDNSYVMLPTNSVIVEKCAQFEHLGFCQQNNSMSSSITPLYSHSTYDQFPYVMFYTTGESTLYFYTSEAYILWTGSTYTYTWNKYNKGSSTSVQFRDYNSGGYQDGEPDYIIWKINSYSANTNYRHETAVHQYPYYRINITSATKIGRMDSVTSLPSGYYTIDADFAPTWCNVMYKGPSSIVERQVDEDGDNNTESLYDMPNVLYTYANEIVTYSKGTTSYGQVTSTNRSAYPDNNYSGDYWYVYAGSTANQLYYTSLPYIKTTGTQYINTNFKPDSYTRIVLDCDVVSNSTQQALVGSRQTNASFLVFTYNDCSGYQVDYSGYQQYPVGSTSSGRHTIDFNQNKFYVDGTLRHTFTASYFGCSYPIYIGSINNSGSAMTSYPASMTIYSCKIYNNGTLVRDLVPAQSNTGTIGMFDKCNNVFYTNAGTGSFITALPEKQLTAIESTGTQYIDTGIIPSVGYRAEVDFQATSEPTSNWWILSAVVSASKLWRAGINASSFRTDGGFTYSQTSSKTSRTIATGTCTTSLTIPLYLFAQNEGGACEFGKYRLYSCKIYDNANTLVRNFVPYRNSDGAIGLYDLVNSKFYANAGTGAFTAIE